LWCVFIMENNFIALASGFTCDGVFNFGKHKGKSFIEVAESRDADYFMWLWSKKEKGGIYLDKELFHFIISNLDRLKKEGKRCKDIYDAERYDELIRDW